MSQVGWNTTNEERKSEYLKSSEEGKLSRGELPKMSLAWNATKKNASSFGTMGGSINGGTMGYPNSWMV